MIFAFTRNKVAIVRYSMKLWIKTGQIILIVQLQKKNKVAIIINKVAIVRYKDAVTKNDEITQLWDMKLQLQQIKTQLWDLKMEL